MRTVNQEKIERLADFINQYTRDNNGSSPSLYEIMEYMSMSRSTAYRYILELEKRGLVSYSGKNTLETELQRKMRCGFKRIPCSYVQTQSCYQILRRNNGNSHGRFLVLHRGMAVHFPSVL